MWKIVARSWEIDKSQQTLNSIYILDDIMLSRLDLAQMITNKTIYFEQRLFKEIEASDVHSLWVEMCALFLLSSFSFFSKMQCQQEISNEWRKEKETEIPVGSMRKSNALNSMKRTGKNIKSNHCVINCISHHNRMCEANERCNE